MYLVGHHKVGPCNLETPSYCGILYLQIGSHYKKQIMRKTLQCFAVNQNRNSACFTVLWHPCRCKYIMWRLWTSHLECLKYEVWNGPFYKTLDLPSLMQNKWLFKHNLESGMQKGIVPQTSNQKRLNERRFKRHKILLIIIIIIITIMLKNKS